MSTLEGVMQAIDLLADKSKRVLKLIVRRNTIERVKSTYVAEVDGYTRSMAIAATSPDAAVAALATVLREEAALVEQANAYRDSLRRRA